MAGKITPQKKKKDHNVHSSVDGLGDKNASGL